MEMCAIPKVVLSLFVLWIGMTGTLCQSPESDKSEMKLLHRVALDEEANFILLWTPLEKEIVFEVQVKTLGYVGLGISPDGEMAGADIVMGWIDNSGNSILTDRMARDCTTPEVDPVQDYILINGFKNDSHTTLRFSRPYVTCDEENDLPIDEGTHRIIWAYDSQVPESPDATLNYHEFRGVRSLILRGQWIDDTFPEATMQWEIMAENVSVPTNLDTLYWCRMYKLPDLKTKHHVIGFSPIIQSENKGTVHHILLYECPINDVREYDKWISGNGAQCYTPNMPLSWTECMTNILAGWAIGGSAFATPEEVGLPIGEDHGGSTYFVMEIHYDNQNFKEGIVDNSGFRVHLTDKLRKYEGGTLMVGSKVSPAMIIPQKYHYGVTSYCSEECTEKFVPESGIQVFATLLHAHLLGLKIKVQLIRDGKEQPTLTEDKNYDFNYQEIRSLRAERTLYPKDSLLTTCIYDSSKKDSPTFGGLGTNDEMCFVYLFYYPRMKMGKCISMPPSKELLEGLGLEEVKGMKKFVAQQSGRIGEQIIAKSEKFAQAQMSKLRQPGENSIDFNMPKKLFGKLEIQAPETYKGTNLYEYIMKNASWDNEEMVRKFHEATTKKFITLCKEKGAKPDLKSNPIIKDYPSYVPYEKPKLDCIEGSSLQ